MHRHHINPIINNNNNSSEIEEYLDKSLEIHKNTNSMGEDLYDNSHKGLIDIYKKLSLNNKEKDLLTKFYIGKEFSECSIGWSSNMFNSQQKCLSDNDIMNIAVSEDININNIDPNTLRDVLKQELNCKTESCLIKNRVDDFSHRFKPKQIGAKTKGLVDNHYCEAFLNQLETNYPFKSMKVVCSDFYPPDEYVDNLGFTDHDDSIRYLGGIYNTGTVRQGGKHWISAFIELDHSKKSISIEYFNSSGRPHPFLKNYLMRIAERYNEKYDNVYSIKFIDIGNSELQKNDTYCGFYSCLYILFRLFGIPAKYLNYPYIWNDEVLKDVIPKLSNKLEPEGGYYKK